MEKLGGMDKKAYVVHEDDVPWETVAEGIRIKKLLCIDNCGKSPFYAGIAEFEPGVSSQTVKCNLAHCTYILEGEVWARLGRQRLQLEKEASTYFPANVPFAYEASGTKGLRLLFSFATENEIGEEHLAFEAVPEDEARSFYQANCPSNLMSPGAEVKGYRWATAGDTDPYIIVEAAQGKRSLSFQSFFDDTNGCKEMWWGRTYLRANCRYTPHYHEQPEFFYFLQGKGTMYGGPDVYQVRPGSIVYAPGNCLHGMVNDGAEPLCAIYDCDIEKTAYTYERIEVSDVPLIPPADRTDKMLSKV